MSAAALVMAGAANVADTAWGPSAVRGTTYCGLYVPYLSKFFAFALAGTAYSSTDGINWSVSAYAQNIQFYSVAASSNLIVAVGTAQQAAYSADGISWTITTPFANTAYAVAYGNSTFVAVGLSGSISTSTNGISWTARTSGTTNALYGVTYSSTLSLFIAVGASGTILTSPDGTTWTTRTSGTTATLNSVAASTTKVVAVGDSGQAFHSPTGVTWTAASTTLGVTLNGICWNGTNFCAVGNTATTAAISTDGVTWSATGAFPIGAKVWWVASSPSLTIGGYSAGAFVYSSSLATWSTSATTVYLGVNTTDGVYGSGRYVLCGYSLISGAYNAHIRYGTSPFSITTLATVPSGAGVLLYAAAYGASKYVCAGSSGKIYYSADAITWTAATTGTTNTFNDVVFNGSIFVAVGAGGIVFTSPDGVTWTSRTSGVTSELKNVVWTGTKFVALQTFPIACISSADGITWGASVAVGTNTTALAAYGGGMVLFVSGVATYVSTNDGASWTTYAGGVANVFGLVYANNMFVASRSNAVFYASANGSSWTDITNASGVNKQSQFYNTTSNGLMSDGNVILSFGSEGSVWASPPPATISL